MKTTLVSALAGAHDVGAELGSAAVTAVRRVIKAAVDIGGDLGAVTKQAIKGTVEVAG